MLSVNPNPTNVMAFKGKSNIRETLKDCKALKQEPLVCKEMKQNIIALKLQDMLINAFGKFVK